MGLVYTVNIVTFILWILYRFYFPTGAGLRCLSAWHPVRSVPVRFQARCIKRAADVGLDYRYVALGAAFLFTLRHLFSSVTTKRLEVVTSLYENTEAEQEGKKCHSCGNKPSHFLFSFWYYGVENLISGQKSRTDGTV